MHVSLDAVKDQILPTSSRDTSGLQLDFWPHKGVTEWLKFEWDNKHLISSVKVYWFDDTSSGACRLPESWQVLYRNDQGNFVPVENDDTYPISKDTFNKITFKSITTDAIKIEIKLQKDWAAGVQEVVIE